MGRHAVASTSRAMGEDSFFRDQQHPNISHKVSTLGTNLKFKNDYQRALDEVDNVTKMQQFLLDEKTEDDVFLFCIARAPDKVPLMVKALLEIGDLKRCKDLFFFQDKVRFYTPFMLAMHENDPVATKVLTLVEHIFEDDLQGLKTILMAQSQGELTPWMLLADAQISERDFKVRLESMLGFCLRLGNENLIEHLSQTTLEDENILMMMCQKRPGSLESLLDLLSEGFRPKELIKLLLQKNASGENLFTHALQAPNSIRLKNLRVILSLVYRLPHLEQIEFIRGCLLLHSYEVLENADVLMAATYLLSNKLSDFLDAVEDETFAKKLMYVPDTYKNNIWGQGPNALQLAIMQNKPEKVRLLLQCLERSLPQHRLQKVLRHWPSYSSAEKGGDALWFAIMHCPTVVPEILAFMDRHDREGLRRSLNGHTYILHTNGDGREVVKNSHRIMTHASAKLPPDIFKDFLDIISERGFLPECLKNPNYSKPLASYPWTLNQVRHCFELGKPENRSALLQKISEMEPTQQQAILNKQVLLSLPRSHKSLILLREVLERFTPCIKQTHPEEFQGLLQTGFMQSYEANNLKMRDYFLSMLKAHRNTGAIFGLLKSRINIHNIERIGQVTLKNSLPLVRAFFPGKEKIGIFSAGLRLLIERKDFQSISIIVNEMRHMPHEEIKAILDHDNTDHLRGQKGKCFNIIKAQKLKKNSSDQAKSTLEEIKQTIKDLYSGKYLQSSAGASSSTGETSRRRPPRESGAEDEMSVSSSSELSGNWEVATLTPAREGASLRKGQGFRRLPSTAPVHKATDVRGSGSGSVISGLHASGVMMWRSEEPRKSRDETNRPLLGDSHKNRI